MPTAAMRRAARMGAVRTTTVATASATAAPSGQSATRSTTVPESDGIVQRRGQTPMVHQSSPLAVGGGMVRTCATQPSIGWPTRPLRAYRYDDVHRRDEAAGTSITVERRIALARPAMRT